MSIAMAFTKDRNCTDDDKLGVSPHDASGRVSKRKRRLRPWLLSLVDSQEIPGLCWVDREETKFKIPWKHGAKQDWSPESGRIFMEWAKHTGKYREGVDRPRYAHWKTRLRCAFNKARDIVEVVDERQPLEPDPYRVYQFTSPATVVGMSRSRRPPTSTTSSTAGASQLHVCMPETEACATALPTVLAQYEQSLCAGEEDHTRAEALHLDHALLPDQHSEPPAPRLQLKIYYRGRAVVSRVTEGRVCHFQYNHVTTSTGDAHQTRPPDHLHALLANSELVELPPFTSEMSNSLQDEKIANQLLSSALCHAMYIYTTDNGDIYAYRQCRCAVYHASTLATSGQPAVKIALQGSAMTQILNHADHFAPALTNYTRGSGVRPDPHVHLLCGQSVSTGQLDSRLLVRVRVTSQRAVDELAVADNIVKTRHQ